MAATEGTNTNWRMNWIACGALMGAMIALLLAGPWLLAGHSNSPSKLDIYDAYDLDLWFLIALFIYNLMRVIGAGRTGCRLVAAAILSSVFLTELFASPWYQRSYYPLAAFYVLLLVMFVADVAYNLMRLAMPPLTAALMTVALYLALVTAVVIGGGLYRFLLYWQYLGEFFPF